MCTPVDGRDTGINILQVALSFLATELVAGIHQHTDWFRSFPACMNHLTEELWSIWLILVWIEWDGMHWVKCLSWLTCEIPVGRHHWKSAQALHTVWSCATSCVVVGIHNEFFPGILRFIVDVIYCQWYGCVFEDIEQVRWRCLTVEELWVISARKGECTQEGFSLAGTRLTRKEWHTSMPTVLDHFLICSTHNATGHCSKTYNCVVWHECFDGSIELSQAFSFIKWGAYFTCQSVIELSPVDWSHFPSPSRWTLREKTHSSKPSLATLLPMEHAVSILWWLSVSRKDLVTSMKNRLNSPSLQSSHN